jgi:hypothetical protein
MTFFLSGAYASFISNTFLIYLKMSKKFKQKCYNSMFYVSMKSFQEKPTFYMIYVKMIKFGTKISLFVTFFVFFAKATKNIHFSMKLCMSKV